MGLRTQPDRTSAAEARRMLASEDQGTGSKHEAILEGLAADARERAAVVGFLVFGSVARGTQRVDSDIDVLTVLEGDRDVSGIRNRMVDGIKVGDLYFTRGPVLGWPNPAPLLQRLLLHQPAHLLAAQVAHAVAGCPVAIQSPAGAFH